MNWREVNPTHADYNGSRTSKRHRRSKLEYKFQDQENSEDIFSFGSTLEDFIYVVFVLVRNINLRGSGGESFWEEGDDFGVDVLLFHTCLTDILGFLKKLELWFEQDIDDEEEKDEEGEGDSEV
ncbi:hypothetical protein Tco_0775630 [Tanacetum coccineum]